MMMELNSLLKYFISPDYFCLAISVFSQSTETKEFLAGLENVGLNRNEEIDEKRAKFEKYYYIFSIFFH